MKSLTHPPDALLRCESDISSMLLACSGRYGEVQDIYLVPQVWTAATQYDLTCMSGNVRESSPLRALALTWCNNGNWGAYQKWDMKEIKINST